MEESGWETRKEVAKLLRKKVAAIEKKDQELKRKNSCSRTSEFYRAEKWFSGNTDNYLKELQFCDSDRMKMLLISAGVNAADGEKVYRELIEEAREYCLKKRKTFASNDEIYRKEVKADPTNLFRRKYLVVCRALAEQEEPKTDDGQSDSEFIDSIQLFCGGLGLVLSLVGAVIAGDILLSAVSFRSSPGNTEIMKWVGILFAGAGSMLSGYAAKFRFLERLTGKAAWGRAFGDIGFVLGLAACYLLLFIVENAG